MLTGQLPCGFGSLSFKPHRRSSLGLLLSLHLSLLTVSRSLFYQDLLIIICIYLANRFKSSCSRCKMAMESGKFQALSPITGTIVMSIIGTSTAPLIRVKPKFLKLLKLNHVPSRVIQ